MQLFTGIVVKCLNVYCQYSVTTAQEDFPVLGQQMVKPWSVYGPMLGRLQK